MVFKTRIRMKINKNTKCLVIKGDKIREGIIIDALRDMVRVELNLIKIGWFRIYFKKWYPIKGKKVRVEFKSIDGGMV